MNLSDEELKLKFDEYNAAGKFDYLKSFALTYAELSVRAYNCLKSSDIKSLYDLIGFYPSDFRKFRNFGKNSYDEMPVMLSTHKALIFSGDKNGDTTFPNFENLYNSGQLDNYLAEGEALADQKDPMWREKLGLPPRVEEPKSDPLEEFIRNKAQTDFTPEQKKLLLMPVDELPLPAGNALADLMDNGIVILAEVVYNDNYYLEQHNVPRVHIPNIVEKVQELGFTGIGFRKNAEQSYRAEQRLQAIQASQQDYASKLGLKLDI